MKFFVLILSFSFLFGEYFYSQHKQINLTPISITRDGIKYYKLDNGEILGVNNYILVKFKKNVDIDKYLKEYNLTIINKIRDIYVLKTPINQALKIADKLYNLDDVVFAHPDFIHTITKR